MMAIHGAAVRSVLQVAGLSCLMERTAGNPGVVIGLIDGPVANLSDLATENIRVLPSTVAAAPDCPSAAPCAHGTYVAGILAARRESQAPAICPACTLFVRPIFLEPTPGHLHALRASPSELADAIVECIDAGARLLNLSVALATPSPNREPRLERALDHAAARGTLVVVAAGNQGTVGGSAITRHPWVIPVAACDLTGRPMAATNVGSSIARRGLMAPGEAITSLGTDGRPVISGGTSAAAPFVTGALALLWSIFPDASTPELKSAVARAEIRRTNVVPPLLDAWTAYERIWKRRARG